MRRPASVLFPTSSSVSTGLYLISDTVYSFGPTGQKHIGGERTLANSFGNMHADFSRQ